MIFGKVLNNNKIYLSPVFAISCRLRNCKVIIFDETYSKLIVIDLYKNNKNTIFYLKYDYSDFAIQEENFKSYWNDKSIFSKVIKNTYSYEMIEESKKILNMNDIGEYYQIDSVRDLEGLDINVGGFHDAYVLAMKQNAEITEILIDTTWGSLIVLKCFGVLNNELKIGDSFSSCIMNIEKDNNINFLFDSFDGRELLLNAKKIEYKSFFVINCKTNSFNYKFCDNNLIISNGEKKYIINQESIVEDILDLKERNIIGYFYNDDEFLKCIVLFKDFAVSYYEYINLKKLKNRIYDKFNKFKIECKEHNYSFDKYPWIDYEGSSVEEHLGELVYRKDYNKLYMLWYNLKYAIIGPLIWNFIWLLVQILNPKMKWTIYFIMGLGSTCLVMIIIFMIYIKELLSKSSMFTSFLEIREKGIIYVGKTPSFSVPFDLITDIEYDREIIIKSEHSKYILHKSKDDEAIFKLLKENFENYKSIKGNNEK